MSVVCVTNTKRNTRKMAEVNYITVESKVRSIVDSLIAGGTEIKYLFANWAQTNVEFSKVKEPTIVYVLPASGDLDISWREIKDSPETQIAFIDRTKFDFNSTENDEIIERMKRLCYRFIKQLNESGLFELVEGKIHYRVIYNYLDENVTGVVINITLKEIEGTLIC